MSCSILFSACCYVVGCYLFCMTCWYEVRLLLKAVDSLWMIRWLWTKVAILRPLSRSWQLTPVALIEVALLLMTSSPVRRKLPVQWQSLTFVLSRLLMQELDTRLANGELSYAGTTIRISMLSWVVSCSVLSSTVGGRKQGEDTCISCRVWMTVVVNVLVTASCEEFLLVYVSRTGSCRWTLRGVTRWWTLRSLLCMCV